MNGKQAKRLRKAAMGLATTLSEAGRDIKRDGYEVKDHGVKLGKEVRSTQVLVRKDSLKGIYKTLKSGKA